MFWRGIALQNAQPLGNYKPKRVRRCNCVARRSRSSIIQPGDTLSKTCKGVITSLWKTQRNTNIRRGKIPDVFGIPAGRLVTLYKWSNMHPTLTVSPCDTHPTKSHSKVFLKVGSSESWYLWLFKNIAVNGLSACSTSCRLSVRYVITCHCLMMELF